VKNVFRPASGKRALAILAGAVRALYEAKDHVTTITLNRPDRLNAIAGADAGVVLAGAAHADNDADVRVIIITGAGRGFCAGLDLKDLASGTGIGSNSQ
jgi:enoyl-CoA hydratase/carnithine racemase